MIRYIFTGHIYLATIESLTWRDFKGGLCIFFFFNSIKDINTVKISFKKCVSLLHFPDRIIITMIKSSAHAVSTMMLKWGIYLLISFSVLNMIIQYSWHRSVSTKITNSEEIFKIFVFFEHIYFTTIKT